MIDLPTSWEVFKLGDVITDIRPGFSSAPHSDKGRGIPHLRPMNITLAGTINLDQLKYVQTDSTLRAKAGDILFNNTNSLEQVGKSAVLDQEGEWAYSNHLTRLRMPDGLIAEFVALQLLLLLRIYYFRLHARRYVNQVGIGVRQLKAIPLIVAPIKDQRDLAEHVQSRYHLIDDVESTMNRAKTLLGLYELETIKSAATGALIRNRDDQLARPWQLTTIANAGEIQIGKARSPKSRSGPNMRPYLRVANVQENRIDTADIHEMNFTPAEFEKYKLISGDVLLNEGQSPDLVGRPAMFRGEVDNCCYQNSLIRFRSHEDTSPAFALLIFRYYLHSGRFREAARWSTNIAHLSVRRFAPIEFPKVPLAEQEAIVGEATRLLDYAARLTGTLDETLGRVAGVRDKVLTGAFHVVQDLSDARQMAEAQLSTLQEEPPGGDRQVQSSSTSGRRGGPRPLLEVLSEGHVLEANALFSQAGFTKESVDDFYQELRGLVRSGNVAEVRLPDGIITLQPTGDDQ